MAEVSNKVVYSELLAVERQLGKLDEQLRGNLALLRLINQEADEGRRRIDAARRRFEAVRNNA